MFNGLSEDELSTLFSTLKSPISASKGKDLYINGMIGIILNGTATVKRCNDVGDSITIRNMSCGELFGIVSLFGDWKNGKSCIIANEQCEILYLSEEEFVQLIKKYPQISINYIKYLSEKIRFLNQKLDAFTTKSTEERLYEYLLSQSNEKGLVDLGFGMAELARRINVGRTSIYRDIESLQSKGLISREGHNFKIKK